MSLPLILILHCTPFHHNVVFSFWSPLYVIQLTAEPCILVLGMLCSSLLYLNLIWSPNLLRSLLKPAEVMRKGASYEEHNVLLRFSSVVEGIFVVLRTIRDAVIYKLVKVSCSWPRVGKLPFDSMSSFHLVRSTENSPLQWIRC